MRWNTNVPALQFQHVGDDSAPEDGRKTRWEEPGFLKDRIEPRCPHESGPLFPGLLWDTERDISVFKLLYFSDLFSSLVFTLI